MNRRKHHLHRKAQVLLCELSNAYALLISRSDLQCFSHEDECFAAGNELWGQPLWSAAWHTPDHLSIKLPSQTGGLPRWSAAWPSCYVLSSILYSAL